MLLACFALSSCVNISAIRSTKGLEKRRYLKGYYLLLNSKQEIPPEAVTSQVNAMLPSINKDEFKISSKPFSNQTRKRPFGGSLNTSLYNKVVEQTDSVSCTDEITFKDGTQVTARIIAIDLNDIIYLRCDNLSGPKYVVRKETIATIEYSNGAQDTFNDYETPAYVRSGSSEQHAVEGLAVTSIMLGVLGLFSLLLLNPVTSILGLLALLFGMAAIIKIPLSREKRAGLGLAITGLFMGLLITVLGVMGLISSIFNSL